MRAASLRRGALCVCTVAAGLATGVVLAQNGARMVRPGPQTPGIAAAHPACPGAGDCCDPAGNGTPGCDDEECCNLICDTMDPFCCDSFWDALCASQALEACELCPSCVVECPPGAVDEGEPCLVDGDIDNVNGGCGGSEPALFTHAACAETFCGQISTYVVAGNSLRDTDWYLMYSPGPGVTIDVTLVSKFPGVCFLVTGVGPGGNPCSPEVVGLIGCADQCTNIQHASAHLPAGPVVVFVSSGTCDGSGIYDGLPCGNLNEYVLTIDCLCGCQADDDCPDGQICIVCQCLLPPPFNDQCIHAIPLEVEPGGSVQIDGTTVNAISPDAECVTSTTAAGVWYRVTGHGHTMTASTCNHANFDTKISVFCGACLPGDGNDCCFANYTPKCEDPECASLICAIDPYCCNVTWEGICAIEALDLCSICQPSLICVDGLDDTPGCAGSTTELSWCAQANADYSILVHGGGEATGTFTLTVSDDGNECTPTVDCPAQCVTDEDCPPGHACVDGKCVLIPSGACCQCDGPIQFCSIEIEANCLLMDGLYLGDGAPCAAPGFDPCAEAYPDQCVLEGRLDIKPGSCPNSYNNKGTGNGKLPASLVGTDEIDVALIDPSTLLLSRADGVGGAVAPLAHFTGIGDDAAPFDGDLCGCHELVGDGVPDLKMKFHRTTVTEVLQLGDLPGNVAVELVLTGNLTDGQPFAAADCIRIVPAGPAAY
jgi:hypothetical protein